MRSGAGLCSSSLALSLPIIAVRGRGLGTGFSKVARRKRREKGNLRSDRAVVQGGIFISPSCGGSLEMIHLLVDCCVS